METAVKGSRISQEDDSLSRARSDSRLTNSPSVASTSGLDDLLTDSIVGALARQRSYLAEKNTPEKGAAPAQVLREDASAEPEARAKKTSLLTSVVDVLRQSQIGRAALIAGTAALMALSNAGKALGDLVTFYDNTNEANITNQAFPNTIASNSGASAVFGRLQFGEAGRITEFSWIGALAGGNANNIDYGAIGLITGDPLSYDGLVHGQAGIGNYSLVEQESLINSADIQRELLGNYNILGINMSVYNFTVSNLDLNFDANQAFSPVMRLRPSVAGNIPLMLVSGQHVNDFGYYRADSNFTNFLSEFSFGQYNGTETAAMYRARGELSGIPEPSSFILLGAAASGFLLTRRRREEPFSVKVDLGSTN